MKTLNFRHTVAACCLGYMTQALVINFAPLSFITFQSEFGIPLGKVTALITLTFLVQLVVDFLSTGIVKRFGYRITAVAAELFAATGLILLGFLPDLLSDAYLGLVISVLFYSFGGGLLETVISPIVDGCPSDNKSASMSFLHSFYSWGVVVTVLFSTLAMGLFGRESWRTLALCWAALPLFNAFFFAAVPLPEPPEVTGKAMGIRALIRNKIFWFGAAMMLCSGAAELCMAQWASAFAESGLGVSKTTGDLLGPCLFSVMMGVARVADAKWGKPTTVKRNILISAGLCILSYLIAVLSPWPIFGLFGCALCGYSVGIFWPGTLSLSASRLQSSTALFSFLALFGDMGCTVGPTLVGSAASLFGDNLKTGLAFGLLFPTVIFIMMILTMKKE